jgi:hypothetical protein
MTRELIIEGEHMDLAPDTSVTLEFVSNTVGDLGKINLSHSYTIKLPKTLRNSRILDAPGLPGHASQRTRRFLSARFIQNGVDLIGPARAYILQTTPDAYELSLVWNTLEPLQVLSESDATINDLPDLPVLSWINASGVPDYSLSNLSKDAFFAVYNSGLGSIASSVSKTSTHPCMRLDALVRRILNHADIPYTISANAQEAIGNKVILAAPGHKPNRNMEIASGIIASAVRASAVQWSEDIPVGNRYPAQYIGVIVSTTGWDKVKGGTRGSSSSKEWPYVGQLWETSGVDHHVVVNLRAEDGIDLSGATLRIYGYGADGSKSELIVKAFLQDNTGGWYVLIDEDIKVSGFDYYGLLLVTPTVMNFEFYTYDDGLPLLSLNKIHDTIDLTKDNRFPIEGNLPDIRQWDFIKATMAICGLAPIIASDTLKLYTYGELLDRTDAFDWTSKVDMTNGGPEVLKYSLDGWAQHNQITFKENLEFSGDPTAELIVDDSTIKEIRTWFDLPFAASRLNSAEHYDVTYKDDGSIEIEDDDIAPRIFNAEAGRPIFSNSQVWLYFNEDMYASGIIDAHYRRLQEVVRTPVVLSVNMRLHEADLATLDLARPIYLEQFGQYYGILKIQTGSDLCKVELIQLS